MNTFDGEFLRPGGFGPIEYPEPRTHLQERLEGQQIAVLHYLDEAGPTGSRGLAVELTTGAKLIIWAGRDRYSKYSARLFFRLMESPMIITPGMARTFSHGERGERDELQQALEGEVIRGVIHHREPTKVGGEQVEVELVGGRRWRLAALPMERILPGGQTLLADIEWAITDRQPTRVVMP